jgi:uncharacterized protein
MSDSDTNDILIDYPTMIDDAMRGVVREALRQVEREGALPGEHHFFITFDTSMPGVEISPQLKAKYPGEMTIVIQHQFWDLKVEPDRFAVTLSFSKRPEKLVIPFAAMTAFADPSIKFGLQFHLSDEDYDEDDLDAAMLFDDAPPGNDEDPAAKGKKVRPAAEVFSIDSFRKK